MLKSEKLEKIMLNSLHRTKILSTQVESRQKYINHPVLVIPILLHLHQICVMIQQISSLEIFTSKSSIQP